MTGQLPRRTDTPRWSHSYVREPQHKQTADILNYKVGNKIAIRQIAISKFQNHIWLSGRNPYKEPNNSEHLLVPYPLVESNSKLLNCIQTYHYKLVKNSTPSHTVESTRKNTYRTIFKNTFHWTSVPEDYLKSSPWSLSMYICLTSYEIIWAIQQKNNNAVTVM